MIFIILTNYLYLINAGLPPSENSVCSREHLCHIVNIDVTSSTFQSPVVTTPGSGVYCFPVSQEINYLQVCPRYLLPAKQLNFRKPYIGASKYFSHDV